MDYEHRSDCWYKDVCQIAVPICNSCTRFLEMSYLLESSGIPESRQHPVKLIPDDIDYEAFCRLDEIKGHIDYSVFVGDNVYICSKNTGNGKTSWAIKMMLKYFDIVWAGNGLKARGIFVHVPTLVMKLKNFENPLPEWYKQYLTDLDLVIWDDIAYTDATKFEYANLLMLIDNRIFSGKANIFTSNIVNKRDLDACLGNKLSSRIWNTSELIELKGKDRRNGNITNHI